MAQAKDTEGQVAQAQTAAEEADGASPKFVREGILLAICDVPSERRVKVRILQACADTGGSSGEVKTEEVAKGAPPLLWSEALEWLQGEKPDLRKLMCQVLKEMPFDAFFWECPPVSLTTAQH